MKIKIREYTAKNRNELLERLLVRGNMGDDVPLALAYLINELVPADRTTKRVLSSLLGENSE